MKKKISRKVIRINPERTGMLRVTMFALLMLAMACTRKADDHAFADEHRLPDSFYIQTGNTIVAATFDILRQSLLSAIGTKGMEEAIAFCNEQAYPLTTMYADSVAINRTSVRVRNTQNTPDSLERLVLQEFDVVNRQATRPGVKIIRAGGEIHFFKPIMLQAMCLNCHGIPNKEIQPGTLRKIHELYPLDSAVDFKEGDLRGVWHIVFRSSSGK